MWDDLFRDITALGGLPLYAAVSGIMLIQFWDLGLLMVYGLIAAYALTAIIRACYYKERPKPVEHNNFIEKIDASSFPSLHSMRATILAFLLGTMLVHPLQRAILGFCWIAACTSRIELDKHDLKDVIGGVFLGVLIAYSLLQI